MRIATVCFSKGLGGLELATLRRAAELRDRGHHVLAIVPDAPDLIRYAEGLGLSVEVITPVLPYLDLPAARMLSIMFERDAIELALVGRTRDLSTVMLAAGRNRAVVLYQQMQSGLDKHDWFHNRVYKRLDACITITQQGREEMVRNTVLTAEKIAVIPYGVDSPRFSPDVVDRDEARAGFDLPPNALAVGIIGQVHPAKGQREFLEALRIVAERMPEIGAGMRGLVIGLRESDAPDYIAELNGLREKLPNITFHPFVTDPRSAFRALDIFVLASHSETFGMVVQEAMAMGLPVIATEAGGVPEIVRHEENGLLVPPKDPQAIADAIIRLACDPPLRERLGSAARSFVLHQYDPLRQYNAFERVLDEAVARREA